MKWSANRAAPQRDGMDVYDLRAFLAPFSLKALSFELEYAQEDNGDALDSTAWNAQVALAVRQAPGNRSSPIATRCSKATIRIPRRTKPSTAC